MVELVRLLPFSNHPIKLARKDLCRYFPKEMNTNDMVKKIFELLEKYSEELKT